MVHIQAPNSYQDHLSESRPSIFLAGSIEMGKAEKWQDAFVEEMAGYDVLILNPRRENWSQSGSMSVEQSIDNPYFREQVEWELQALEDATIILMYLQPDTKSPISMLEFGIHAKANPEKLIVCCPDGFWRKGNIDIVATKYGVKVVENKKALLTAAKEQLNPLL